MNRLMDLSRMSLFYNLRGLRGIFMQGLAIMEQVSEFILRLLVYSKIGITNS